MKQTVKRLADRWPPAWMPRIRRTTVLAGVALGAVLLAALTLIGVIGIDPLPGLRGAGHSDRPGGPSRADQPSVDTSLLGPDDLRPGYSPGPGTAAPDGAAGPGGPTGGSAGGPPRTPGGQPTGPELAPGLPLGGLPLDSALGELPLGGALGEDLLDGREPESGELGGPAGAATTGLLCRWLFAAPWSLATAGLQPVAAPRAADHLDHERGVRLRQVVGGFSADGARRGIARVRRIAESCPRFRVDLAGLHGGTVPDRPGDDPLAAITVTMRPTPVGQVPADRTEHTGVRPDGARPPEHGTAGGQPADGGTPAAGSSPPPPPAPSTAPAGPPPPAPADAREAYQVRLTVSADGGETWTGYLTVDRVGPVLCLLWHLGPRGVVTADEAAAVRASALAKAQPLADSPAGRP